MKAYAVSVWLCLSLVCPLTAQRYVPSDSISIERIVIERPANFQPGDILIPQTYAAQLQRAAHQLRAFRPRYDSLIRACDSLYHELHYHQVEADSIYGAQRMERERLIDEIYALGADAVQSQDLLYADISQAQKRQRLLKRQQRSGFLRQLLYHPTTTKSGRILISGLVVSFTALTTVTLISLIKN